MAMFVNIAQFTYFSLGNLWIAYVSLDSIKTLTAKCKQTNLAKLDHFLGKSHPAFSLLRNMK